MLNFCGEGGIRTRGTVSRTTVFETATIDHSAIFVGSSNPTEIPNTEIRKMQCSSNLLFPATYSVTCLLFAQPENTYNQLFYSNLHNSIEPPMHPQTHIGSRSSLLRARRRESSRSLKGQPHGRASPPSNSSPDSQSPP